MKKPIKLTKPTRIIALLLAVLTLCMALSACQEKPVPSFHGTPTTAPAEASKDETPDGETAEDPGEEPVEDPEETPQPDVLRVVTDKFLLAPEIKSQIRLAEMAMEEMAEFHGGTPSGIAVELEVIPAEGYDAELTRLRTEIAAGGGPDVFLMSGFGGYSSQAAAPDEMLFPNPESAMAEGMFLPLDAYMENARLMESDKLEPHVMAAGQFEGKQYLMPISYTLPLGVSRQQADADNPPTSWDEGIASASEDVRRQYAVSLAEIPGFRNIVFEQVADNLAKTLTIDEDEFFQRTKEAYALLGQFVQPGETWAGYNSGTWLRDFYKNYPGIEPLNEEDSPAPFFPLRNSQGGTSAGVETWCAVNANTRHPEDAFFIVDLMMCRNFQSRSVYWDTDNFLGNPGAPATVLGNDTFGTIPVYSELLTSEEGRYMWLSFISTEIQRDGLVQAQENITYVYFTSDVDRAIDGMFYELVQQLEQGETLDDGLLRQKTDECYSAIKAMLAES